ncbi:MAG: hypothetical protein IT289_06230 [Oligoflexia bacterium]|nr:hypothetical protein [Oligoflexia bacterium]
MLKWGLVSVVVSLLIPLSVTKADRCDDEMAKLSEKQAAEAKPIDQTAEAVASYKVLENYMRAAREILLEREFVLDEIELALLAREHLIFLGPPGNAKSMTAAIVLGNIVEQKSENGKPKFDAQGKPVEESSYGALAFTSETTLTETHGPLNYPELTQSGRLLRLYDEGFLMLRLIFFDEFFDARPNAIRNVLDILAERAHKQGPRITKGRVETAILASNRYMNEVYERAGDDGPRAVFDRAAFVLFFPGEFESVEAYQSLIQGAAKKLGKMPRLTFEQLDSMRTLVDKVEIPDYVAQFLTAKALRMKAETSALEQASLKDYAQKKRENEPTDPPYRATKYQSPRTIGKEAAILKAIVVRRFLQSGGKTSLRATFEDIKQLEGFNTLGGPSDQFVSEMLERSTDPNERAQLTGILTERRIFRDIYKDLMSQVNEVVIKYSLADIGSAISRGQMTPAEKDLVTQKLIEMLQEVAPEVKKQIRTTELSGQTVGLKLVYQFAHENLQELWGKDYQDKMYEVEQRALEASRKQREAAELARLAHERQKRIEELAKAEEEAKIERKKKLRTELLGKWSENFKGATSALGLNNNVSSEMVWSIDNHNEPTAFIWDKTENLRRVGSNPLAVLSQTTSPVPGDGQVRDIINGTFGNVRKIYQLEDKLVFVTQSSVWALKKDSLELINSYSFPLPIEKLLIGVTAPNGSPSFAALTKNLDRIQVIDLMTSNSRTVPTSELRSLSGSGDFSFFARQMGSNPTFGVHSRDPGKSILIAENLKSFMIIDATSREFRHYTLNTPDGLTLANVNEQAGYAYSVEGKKIKVYKLDLSETSTGAVTEIGSAEISSDIKSVIHVPEQNITLVGTSMDGIVAFETSSGEILGKELAGSKHLVHKMEVKGNVLIYHETGLSRSSEGRIALALLPPPPPPMKDDAPEAH